MNARLDALSLRSTVAAPGVQPQGVPSPDIAALETRLTARLDALSIQSTAAARAGQPQAGPSPELTALTRQVEELGRVVRDRALLDAGPRFIPLEGGGASELVTEMRAPFFQGLELRGGGSRVRSSGSGASLALDALFGDRIIGPLQPFAGFHVGQVDVDGTVGGSAYVGSVTSYGMSAGARLGLPRIRSVLPSLNLGVSGVAGGTRGDTPPDADLVDILYGGFVMGPRVGLTGAWRRQRDGALQVVVSAARLWAGARGGWTVQAGLRWARPSRARTFLRPVGTRSQTAVAPPTVAQPAVQPEAGPTLADSVAAAQQASLLARLDELEQALGLEREARQQLESEASQRLESEANRLETAERQRLEAAADSATVASRAAEAARQAAVARADSLSARADSAVAIQRQRDAAQAARDALEGRLRDLVGVLPSLQNVRRTDQGLEVVLGGSLFPTGATVLGSDTRPQVERIAQIITGGPFGRLVVRGHTDATGSPETNLVISRLRAEAVRQVLVEVGMEANLVDVVALGEQRPMAPNDTVDGRRLNRRVEILIRAPEPRP